MLLEQKKQGFDSNPVDTQKYINLPPCYAKRVQKTKNTYITLSLRRQRLGG